MNIDTKIIADSTPARPRSEKDDTTKPENLNVIVMALNYF